jgi:plasmid stabilization system protein ParE
MSIRIVIEPEAEADVAEAYRWYEDQRSGLGADFVLCVEAALSVLAERPRMFPKVHGNARRVLIRRFPYLILFVEQTNLIVVLGVFHTKRNPKRWRRRLSE